MLTSIVGINWGDEGKGRMVDLLAENYNVVVRYQGGNNAGHTVVDDKGKFILNLLPSGILRDNVVNVMGNGMVIDLKHLCGEIDNLAAQGISIDESHLKISDKAIVCFPYHVLQDCLEENRLADRKFGSTRRGIAPVYGDKYMKKAIRMGELLYPESLKERLKDIIEWKNLTVEGAYKQPSVKFDEIWAYVEEYGSKLKKYVTDAGEYLENAVKSGKNIMFEAQLGALRDIDFGIYPYTSSSSTIAAYSTIGAGIPQYHNDNVIGIMKAYSTCVGEGPFTAEYFGDKAKALRDAGAEYGAATGRPRRVGPFDAVASRYGCKIQGSTEVALTKLDVLSGLDEIEICTAYELDGKRITEFPFSGLLAGCKPIIEKMPGWKCDISFCRKSCELPREAIEYIKRLEELVGCKITYVSVGASREEYLIMEN